MPVFISHSHQDKDFVDKLATHLIKANAHVWVDRWEIKVGESILNRVQNVIDGETALRMLQMPIKGASRASTITSIGRRIGDTRKAH